MLQIDDLKQIEKKGIPLITIEAQLKNFREGFPFIRLIRPAIQGDGIIVFNEERKNELIRLFEAQSPTLNVIKFVPASGAASRMFKLLFEFHETLKAQNGIPDCYFQDTGFNSVNYFFTNLNRFAFFKDLHAIQDKEGILIANSENHEKFKFILASLLSEEGLNYAALPKALLAFHSYEDGYRVALEEHLIEASHYARDLKGISRIHFTVSPEHISRFDEKIETVRKKYEAHFNTIFDIRHSVQKSSTDTIAVDEDNLPFRNSDGSLLFRPAGHGALLTNLNDLEGGIIFIKNIDNIVPDRLKATTIEYKKLIGGFLLSIRQRIFDFLRKIDSGTITTDDIREMAEFSMTQKLISLPKGFNRMSGEEQCNILKVELNRPIRVCGMVRTQGEPGGGPFWVSGNDGKESLQIVESSQVDLKDQEQSAIFKSSTHFNPVDLVCCTIDYKGIPFNLQDFVDESTGFISLKSSSGRTLKAQELPGLWNGSMSGWITLFVETPLITFNPVKTINDLLRDEHQ